MTWTILELLRTSVEYLKSKEIENPRADVEIMLAHVLMLDRMGLYLNFDRPVNAHELNVFRDLLKRRMRREPVQYIVGHKEFWSLDFEVNRHVLIPRWETELLVEEVLSTLKENDNPPARILDIGTGCGVIAISLAKDIKDKFVYATDISEDALELARKNAKIHNVERYITFLKGHLFEPLRSKTGFFDVVVCNPPYIPTPDFSQLPPEIRYFEPRIALNGGEDGLKLIRPIISQVSEFLSNDGWLMLEIGQGQSRIVYKLIEDTNKFKSPFVIQDYSGIERVVKVQKRS